MSLDKIDPNEDENFEQKLKNLNKAAVIILDSVSSYQQIVQLNDSLQGFIPGTILAKYIEIQHVDPETALEDLKTILLSSYVLSFSPFYSEFDPNSIADEMFRITKTHQATVDGIEDILEHIVHRLYIVFGDEEVIKPDLKEKYAAYQNLLNSIKEGLAERVEQLRLGYEQNNEKPYQEGEEA